MNDANLEKGRATRFKKGDEATRAAARKGGQRAAQAKNLRKVARQMLSLSMAKGKTVDIDKLKSIDGLLDEEGQPKNMSVGELLVLQLVNGALNGDMKALDRLLEMSGMNEVEREKEEETNLFERIEEALDDLRPAQQKAADDHDLVEDAGSDGA